MLELVYRFIEPHFDPRTHLFLTSQTDSLSLSLSEDSLELWLDRCVLPGKRESMLAMRDQFLVLPGKSEAAQRSKYERGLFKKEWDGQIFIVSVLSFCLLSAALKEPLKNASFFKNYSSLKYNSLKRQFLSKLQPLTKQTLFFRGLAQSCMQFSQMTSNW